MLGIGAGGVEVAMTIAGEPFHLPIPAGVAGMSLWSSPPGMTELAFRPIDETYVDRERHDRGGHAIVAGQNYGQRRVGCQVIGLREGRGRDIGRRRGVDDHPQAGRMGRRDRRLRDRDRDLEIYHHDRPAGAPRTIPATRAGSSASQARLAFRARRMLFLPSGGVI